MATQQRFLDIARSLPSGAPEALLEQALRQWNDALMDSTRAKAMSQLRLLVHPRVKRHWRRIHETAEADPTPAYINKFLELARRVRRGEQL